MVLKTEQVPPVQIQKENMKVYDEPLATDVITRQYLVNSSTWAAASVAGTQIAEIRFPQVMGTFTFLAEKLRDYMYVQPTIEYEVRIVCSQYHYGALLISKNFAHRGVSGELPWTYDWRQRTQAEGVILCCNDRQKCRGTFEWTHPFTFMVNASYGDELGTLYLHVFNQLSSISPNSPTGVQVQVWARFTNVRMAAPDQSIGPDPQPQLFAEKHSKKSGQTMQKEAEQKAEKGVLTQIAEATSMIAPFLAPVPVIGEFAIGAGTIAATAAPIFKALGWCKPTSVASVVPTMPLNFKFFTGMDGEDVCLRLGEKLDDLTTLSKECAPFGTWSTSVYDYCRRLGYLQTATWNAAGTLGTVVLNIPHDPYYSADSAPTGSPQTYNVVTTPLSFMSQYFTHWRGSIRYVILFNASSFVSGTVRISYYPSGTIPGAIENYGGDQVSRVVEIKGPTWVPFAVPFQFVAPWHPLQYDQAGVGIPQGPYGANGSSATNPPHMLPRGRIVISVVEPLVVTDTVVNPVVYVSIFSAAGKDFQFGKFCGRHAMVGSYVQYGTRASPPLAEKQTALGSFTEQDFPGLKDGMKLERDHGYVNNFRELSFLELMHKYCAVNSQTVTGNNSVNTELFWHGITGSVWNASGTIRDNLSEFALIHQYWRGSMRLCFYGGVAAQDHVYYRSPATMGNMANTNGLGYGFVPATVYNQKGFDNYELPWLSNLPYRFIYEPANPTPTGTGLTEFPKLIYFHGADVTALARAAGDDFGMSGFLPSPVMNFRTDAPATQISEMKNPATGVPQGKQHLFEPDYSSFSENEAYLLKRIKEQREARTGKGGSMI